MQIVSKLKFLFVLLGFAVLLTLSVAQAEDPKRSGDFFDKNYAASPLKDSQGPEVARPRQAPTAQATAVPEQSKTPTRSDFIEGGLEDSKVNDQKRDDVPVAGKGVPVYAIGMIVNSVKSDHFDAAAKQLKTFLAAHDMRAGTIYMVGYSDTTYASPYVLPLIAMGASFENVVEVPEQYKTALSPTFIVSTAEGEVLLEAVGSLNQYFNGKGEYVDPKRKEQGIPKIGGS